MASNSYDTPTDKTGPPVIQSVSSEPDPSTKIGKGMGTPAPEYEKALLNWLTQALREGEAMLMDESKGESIDENIKMFMGQYHELGVEANKPSYRSCHTENRLGKNINDIASAITDFRPSWHYKTYNKQYENQGVILDKLSVAWWYNNDIDLKLQLLVKQSLVARTGYAYLTYNPMLHNGLGDLDIAIKDYRDVIPIRPNSKITLQDSFGVIVKSRNTVNWAKARFGREAALVKPVVDGSYLRTNMGARLGLTNPALDYLDSQRRKTDDFNIPLYDHYEIYLKDPSINTSNQRKWVGPGPEGEHPWGYWVEAKKPLYPRGRLIVCANMQHILYDGGNPYWHGMFPVSKLTLDPQPWSFLGKSAIADSKQSQLLVNELIQGIVDASRKALRPGIMAEKNAVSRAVLQRLDTRESGWKLFTNPSTGQGVTLEQPLPLPNYVMDLLVRATNAIDYNTGVLDMRAMEQVRALSGNVDVEAMLEYLGPSIRMKGRHLEVFLREIGEMMLYNFFQFYNIGRRVQILGRDGMDFEDFDYDPGSLVPGPDTSHFQSDAEMERFYDKSEEKIGELTRPKYTLKSRSERAKEHCKSFVFFLTPNSLLNLSKSKDQMIYMQLFRMGLLDPQTLLEKLEVPNVGELPGAPKTILERMAAAQQVGMTGVVSAAGRKSSGQEAPIMRNDGKISESGA